MRVTFNPYIRLIPSCLNVTSILFGGAGKFSGTIGKRFRTASEKVSDTAGTV
jgi:hypothetical protein